MITLHATSTRFSENQTYLTLQKNCAEPLRSKHFLDEHFYDVEVAKVIFVNFYSLTYQLAIIFARILEIRKVFLCILI